MLLPAADQRPGRGGDDLGHNFVLAHSGCNGRKRDLLAALPHLECWRRRNEDRGQELAQRFEERSLLHNLDGSHQVARWAYRQAENAGAHVWLRDREVVPLDPGWRGLLGAK